VSRLREKPPQARKGETLDLVARVTRVLPGGVFRLKGCITRSEADPSLLAALARRNDDVTSLFAMCEKIFRQLRRPKQYEA
jgi:hypothetical protein